MLDLCLEYSSSLEVGDGYILSVSFICSYIYMGEITLLEVDFGFGAIS